MTNGKPVLHAGFIYGSAEEDSSEDELLIEFDQLDDENQEKHVYALTGWALFRCQLFEADLHNILLLYATTIGETATQEDLDALDADLSGKTLGNLLRRVQKLVHVNDDCLLVLNEALQLRNQLCHGFFFRMANDHLTVAGRRRMCAE